MSFGATVLAVILAIAVPAVAQDASGVYIGQTVAEVRFEVEGRPGIPVPSEANLRELVDVRPGQPLRRDDVRGSMDHLFALGRYEDIRPVVVSAPTGVIVTFRLVPRSPIDRVEVDVGDGAVSASTLLSELRQRFVGRQPGAVRTELVEDFVHRYLNDDGYLSPVVSVSTVVAPEEDAATLVVKIEAGALAPITTATVENTSPLADADVLERAGAVPGRPYRRREIQSRLTQIEDDLRSRGYYEAQASIEETPTASGVAVKVNVHAGPRVELRVSPSGALPGGTDELIPIKRERSADQDLLEDARARIEGVLRREGYAKASAPFTSVLSTDGQVLLVTFTIDRGARHHVERLDLPPGLSVPEPILRKLIAVSPGTVFDQARFEAGVAAAIDEYRRRGYYQSAAEPSIEPVPGRTTATEAWVVLHPGITEGPRAQIAAVTFAFEGPHQLAEAELRRQLRSTAGAPYVEVDAVRDQDGAVGVLPRPRVPERRCVAGAPSCHRWNGRRSGVHRQRRPADHHRPHYRARGRARVRAADPGRAAPRARTAIGRGVAHDGSSATRGHGCVSQLQRRSGRSSQRRDRRARRRHGCRGTGHHRRIRSGSRGRQPREAGGGRHGARRRRGVCAPRVLRESAGVISADATAP